MILYLEVECTIYASFSLKDKRSVIKRMIAKLRKDFNVSVAELEFQELWQRAKLGIVTISNERLHAEQTLAAVIRTIDSFPEIERTITKQEII
ncbi:DUF503 domain-containing protein [Ornithinibacillus sp. 4-3]|uniref:DUF503 domain-containing protein n=1 Tax=Ornithinibacillus sp. 4-3 TaxID=3231488 RepID=A0AB39HPP9_9BACI